MEFYKLIVFLRLRKNLQFTNRSQKGLLNQRAVCNVINDNMLRRLGVVFNPESKECQAPPMFRNAILTRDPVST